MAVQRPLRLEKTMRLFINGPTRPVLGETGYHLGGKGKQVVTSANQDGRIEVFYIGLNDVIYHNWQTAPNGGYYGGTCLARPARSS